MKKKLAIFFAIFLCALSFVGCNNWTYQSRNIAKQTAYPIVLKAGESYTVDVNEVFKNCDIEIESYKIITEENCNYTVNDNVITAKGTGVSPIKAHLYPKTGSTCYVVTLGTLYSYDESDFDEVKSISDFDDMRTAKSGNYILKANIDLSSVENWQPIGNLPNDDSFKGTFINPYGYKITGLTIASSKHVPNGTNGGASGGLFGSTVDTLLYGIILENVSIDVSDFDGQLSSFAGGLVGSASNTVFANCSVQGNVSANGDAGGICGIASWGDFNNCTFNGNVTLRESNSEYATNSNDTGAGGIVGYCGMPYDNVKSGRVYNCTSSGNITAEKNAGGICGYVHGKENVFDCESQAVLSAQNTGKLYGSYYFADDLN
ncbi:MAG: hypothetical protein IKD03_06035 [Clostridia bacterium]|nr:hypothetical protein [Clostridia bacterium]